MVETRKITSQDVGTELEDVLTNINEAHSLVEDGDYAQAIFELEIAKDSIDSRIEELKALEWMSKSLVAESCEKPRKGDR